MILTVLLPWPKASIGDTVERASIPVNLRRVILVMCLNFM